MEKQNLGEWRDGAEDAPFVFETKEDKKGGRGEEEILVHGSRSLKKISEIKQLKNLI